MRQKLIHPLKDGEPRIFDIIPQTTFVLLFSLFLHPAKGSPPSGGLDTSIIVALVGLGGWPLVRSSQVLLLSIIYQTRLNAKLAQRTTFLERELDRRLQREEREQQQEQSEEAARIAMLRARTLEERIAAYRRALHADPRIARLQILDMTWPLEISAIYVQLRSHQETRPSFQLDADISAERHLDPNVLLRRGQLLLEQRATATLPGEDHSDL